MNEWVKMICEIMSGLVVLIPLVVKLIEYVKAATKEKNWNELMRLTIEYMKTAEEKFSDGATRKEWVLGMIRTSAASINYDLDDAALAKISDLIDSICDASKVINKEISAATAE